MTMDLSWDSLDAPHRERAGRHVAGDPASWQGGTPRSSQGFSPRASRASMSSMQGMMSAMLSTT
jgi:hypothetical protein